MSKIYLALGTNVGDRTNYLALAIQAIAKQIGNVEQISSIYQTAAWGVEDQPDYYNQVVRVTTTLTPLELLGVCQGIEHDLGRVRKKKWGPRVIDIDILSYDNDTVNLPNLVIPHPLMQDRNFVLIPLNELTKDWIHPVFDKSIDLLIKECTDTLEVVKL